MINQKDADQTFYGLNRDTIVAISAQKQEPSWMLDFRLRALSIFENKPMPQWGADLSSLDMENIYYYLKPVEGIAKSWHDVPRSIKQTFDALGIPQAEQKFLAGVGAQFESAVIYKRLKEQWAQKGVIFSDTDSALREHADLFQRYFATVIPPHDNKFAALNSAVWSGGSFVYVPRDVRIEQPLQAYFRINAPRMGQFERTLIIAEPGSFVHYVEGCSAPIHTVSSLHSAVVEIIALPGSHVRYTTIQNWSSDVYNLVTKRAIAYEGARVEWIDGNFGSKVTMKYPCIVLKGKKASGQIISVALASSGQHQDTGGKIIHGAPETSSNIIAKSISKQGGRSSYRGLLKITRDAQRAQSHVVCEALMLDAQSRSDTYPTVQVDEPSASVGHEASISKISEEQLFYLMSRGMSAQDARALIVNGFIDALVKLLPMEYAVEINKLIMHEMEGSIG